MRKHIFTVLLFTMLVGAPHNPLNGQTIHEDKKKKKVDREQHHLNEHRARLIKRENNLDNREREVQRNQKRLNTDQKDIDKQRPVNNSSKKK